MGSGQSLIQQFDTAASLIPVFADDGLAGSGGIGTLQQSYDAGTGLLTLDVARGPLEILQGTWAGPTAIQLDALASTALDPVQFTPTLGFRTTYWDGAASQAALITLGAGGDSLNPGRTSMGATIPGSGPHPAGWSVTSLGELQMLAPIITAPASGANNAVLDLFGEGHTAPGEGGVNGLPTENHFQISVEPFSGALAAGHTQVHFYQGNGTRECLRVLDATTTEIASGETGLFVAINNAGAIHLRQVHVNLGTGALTVTP